MRAASPTVPWPTSRRIASMASRVSISSERFSPSTTCAFSLPSRRWRRSRRGSSAAIDRRRRIVGCGGTDDAHRDFVSWTAALAVYGLRRTSDGRDEPPAEQDCLRALSRHGQREIPPIRLAGAAVGVLLLHAIKIKAEIGEVIKESRLIP